MRPYESLRGDAEFARLRRLGRRSQGTHVAIVAVPAPAGRRPRISIVAAKGLGDAVERNRARRRLRAALAHFDLHAAGQDMIVTARLSATTVAFPNLCEDVRLALGRLQARG